MSTIIDRDRPFANAAASGFTLIEVLVVLAIIAVLVTVALPRLQLDDGTRLRATSFALESDLRLLRNTAMRTGKPTGLIPTIEGYALEPAGLKRSVPTGFTLSAEAPRSDLLLGRRPQIRFFGDGGSTGGILTLRRDTLSSQVEVRGLDGKIIHER